MSIYQQLAQALTQGAVVLATVIQTQGSTPREAGAKMIICDNGCTFSTIGGGAGEAKIIHRALQVLQAGKKERVDIHLSGPLHPESQGVCGGTMQVLLERWSGAAAIALSQNILDCLQTGEPATLVMPFAVDQTPYLIRANNALPPQNAYWEALKAAPRLLIVGAGHVGESLAKVASLAGFRVLVQDDRPDWANVQRYPQAEQIWHEPLAHLLDRLKHDSDLYVAIVTRGYQQDVTTLQVLLSGAVSCQYIGMIGSKKRVRFVYQQLQQQGIDPKALRTIYAPIGLEIGALTPEEIAISICAELIQVRRGGTGKSLSEELRRSPAPYCAAIAEEIS
jgi:xanthine dehydrogenase accessory factor